MQTNCNNNWDKYSKLIGKTVKITGDLTGYGVIVGFRYYYPEYFDFDVKLASGDVQQFNKYRIKKCLNLWQLFKFSRLKKSYSWQVGLKNV